MPPISSVKNTILQLDISWNEISHISDTYFHSCKKIRNIFIHHNQLLEIPNLEYVSRSIHFLSLAANNNSNVIPIYGIRFPKLQTLSLGMNQIKSFCFPPANFAPSVDMVDLHSNYIQIIYFSLAHGPRKHKVYINLEQNPWHCNSSLGWTQQCSQDAHRNVMTCFKWLSVAGMICVSPPGAQGLIPKEAGEILYIYTIQFAKLMQ